MLQVLENTNSCFILWVFISTACLYHCLDFVLIGGKVVSFLAVLEREFIGKSSVAIFWELTFEVEFLDCSRNQPVFVCDQRLLCVGQLDSSALPALEMEQLVSSGPKTARSGEYKENRRHFPENLGTEAGRLTPEGCGQQSKWLLEEPRKDPLIQDSIESGGWGLEESLPAENKRKLGQVIGLQFRVVGQGWAVFQPRIRDTGDKKYLPGKGQARTSRLRTSPRGGLESQRRSEHVRSQGQSPATGPSTPGGILGRLWLCSPFHLLTPPPQRLHT